MSIEDIDFLKKNSIKEDYLFLVDSKKRDFLNYPDPNHYVINFNIPFKNVISIDVIEANIPRTMYSIDKYNNQLFYYIANSQSDPLISNGLNPLNTNPLLFSKLELMPGNYTIQTFIPAFNSQMILNNPNAPIQMANLNNPPELTNKIIFTCKNPFILNMNMSSLAETLGFNLNIKKENDGILYKYIDKYEGYIDFLKVYHSIYNSNTGLYEITSPGIVFFIGEKYIIIRSPEIEEHAFGSLAYNNFNQGIAKFKVSGIGFNDDRVELTKITTREFHPIGKLSKLTFRFETADGNLYDFRGINHSITYVIKYYKPRLINIKEFTPILNPNYKSNFRDYKYLNSDQELSDEEDKNEYSRDNIYDIYKRNELLIKEEIDDEEEDD
jgi:hypothetical protein